LVNQKPKVFVGAILRPCSLVSHSDTQKFCTAASREAYFRRFVRQCESVKFLRKCSERENLETLLKFTRVEEVWRVVGENTCWCPKLKAFSFIWDCSKSIFCGRMPEKSQIFVTKLPG